MRENGIVKIIIAIVVIAIVGVLFFVISNKTKELEFFKTTGIKSMSNYLLVEDAKTLKNLIKEKGISNEIISSTTYSKYSLLERYNDEYFTTGKIAIIALYEDDSKGYIQSIDEVIYNKDRTSVTINYTNRDDGYAGRLSQVWHNYFIVELENTVDKVNYVKANLN